MNDKMTYRQYLQYHANNHGSDIKRKEAQALLNVVDDKGNINSDFLAGEKVDRGWFRSPDIRERQSNGFAASTVNRTLNPWWTDSYKKYSDQWDVDASRGLHGPTKPGPVTYDPYAAQRAAQAKQDRENRAYLDNQINRFDSYFGDADRTRQVRLNNINNEYNNSLNTANRAWQRAQEDYNAATNDRLQTRQRQLSVADDDFKKQRDAYDRYFARIGAGSSSFARYGMPTALARAANKVRNDIEDTNAKNEREQTVVFNRAREDHEKGLSDLLRNKNNQISGVESDWNNTRSSLNDQKAQLMSQRDSLAGKSYDQVIRDSQGLRDEADRLRREAISQRDIKPEFKINPIDYKPALQKDWNYQATETKVDNSNEEEPKDDAYSRYFRDREEEKKRKGWIPALG